MITRPETNDMAVPLYRNSNPSPNLNPNPNPNPKP